MNIFPAIDLFNGKAVRLLKGDYQKMTVYSENPLEIAKDFENSGAEFLHIVDLEGAKTGDTPNIGTIEKIVKNTSLFTEVGGGIRTLETVEKYVNIGVKRAILGTAAVNDEEFLISAVKKYGEKIAVGIDIKDGFVAIKGWTDLSKFTPFEFCVSSIDDIKRLKNLEIYGAIIGKAYYTKAISLAEAIEVAK